MCQYCKNTFFLSETQYNLTIKRSKNFFCSLQCVGKSKTTKHEMLCINCDKQFHKNISQIKKTKNSFCSKSCAATYNNKHKTKGTRVSKLEKWLQQQLSALYPDLEIHYNRKDAINSELDIYIPSLKLAFELNGIFHYEPIYGKEKLEQIENNDSRKFQACLEKGIELCIIDSSLMIHFKEEKAGQYLSIIRNIVQLNVTH